MVHPRAEGIGEIGIPVCMENPVFTQKILEQFTALLKRTINNYINATISERLKAAIKDNEAPAAEQLAEEQATVPVEETAVSKINTTEEELQAFYVVKAILRGSVPAERVTYRDAQTYFAIFIDNNNRKPVCRLYLDSENNKRITFVDEAKKEHHNKIATLDDIYQYADEIIAAAKRYL